jgi:hypothetical protein
MRSKFLCRKYSPSLKACVCVHSFTHKNVSFLKVNSCLLEADRHLVRTMVSGKGTDPHPQPHPIFHEELFGVLRKEQDPLRNFPLFTPGSKLKKNRLQG